MRPIALPGVDVADWMDRNGASVTITCMFGSWNVHVEWRRLHSYSDREGAHRETWDLSRSGSDLSSTVSAAIKAAIERTSK